jgi:spore coat protein CotF
MMAKGYYHPYDPEEQIQIDIKTSDTALNLMG